jgi:tetratricopeptide (TPR) repeat protein
MKKVFFTLFFTALSFSQLACAGDEAANNSNSESANSVAVSENTDANANVAETPLPEFTDANLALEEGAKLLDANEVEKAIEALRQAVKLNPDLAEAHFRLGIAYGLYEREQEESPEFEATPTPTPVKKGKTVEPAKTDSEKSFENAVKAYEKHLKKNPDDDAALFNLGRAYNKLNDDTEAEKALRQAVKLKPEDAEYQLEHGAILIKLAQYEEAVRALKEALKLDPENLEAEEMLEKAQAGKKRIDFGIKPKVPEQQQQQSQTRRSSSRPKSTPKTEDKPAPSTPNANQ